MEPASRRALTLLEAVSEDGGHITQRVLAARLGVALGLTNIDLKRLVRKGYIRCVTVQSNRLRYVITPSGLAEKARLASEYAEQSLSRYREVRERFRAEMRQCLKGDRRVALYGAEAATELAYLCLKELGLEPVAVFDGEADGTFLGMPVLPIENHERVKYDVLLVASVQDHDPILSRLRKAGVDTGRLVLLGAWG